MWRRLPSSCSRSPETTRTTLTSQIITLTGLILLGLIIDLGGVPGQQRIGFAYWQNGRAFKAYKVAGDLGKFCGFVNALAYMGTELIGVTVGEAKVRRFPT
jgi:amino acid transporter